MGLRSFMFEYVYTNPTSKSEEKKAVNVINELFYYYTEHKDELPEEFSRLIAEGDSVERAVCDYIACMTDQYATNTFNNLTIPKAWSVL